MVAADRKERRLRTTELLGAFIRQLETRGYRISEVPSERTYILPRAAGMPQLAHTRAALIGDAASMINPWSGEGIFYGMEAGRILATATADHLQLSEEKLDRALQRFERRFRQRFSRPLTSCYVAHRVTRSMGVSAAILRVAERDKKVFDYLASLMFGEASVDPRMILRMLSKGLCTAGVGARS
jgi:flavin-dependent dehydrogenase